MTRPTVDPAEAAGSSGLQARFLAIVSHELRTPLTTIASFTESLDADGLAPAERSLALAAVRRNTDRMLTLVEDLMLLSRLQTGDLRPRIGEVDLAALIREAAESLAVREPHTETTLAIADGPPVRGDRALLRDLCYAILGTVPSAALDRSAQVAATAGPDGWTIGVVARQAEQLTNEGLMAGTLATPDPPYRRRSTALWMLLAETIADRHGGQVRLTYDPAAGAGAVVHLPFLATTDPRA
jgi:light-regulated signal transduction histidine kinase (bacteriophytochrome)